MTPAKAATATATTDASVPPVEAELAEEASERCCNPHSSMAAAPYGAPPPHQAPAPLAVVSPLFCAPYAVPLTVTKKAISRSGRDFVVTDTNGAEMLRVNGALFSVHDRRVLLDAAGQPLLSMREKVFTMHNRWEVFRGDSTNACDLLFTAKKASIFQVKPEVDVFLAGNHSEQLCDFKIRGSYFERSCGFYLGNSDTMVAQISRKYTATNILLGKDTFVVTVFPHVDYVFITAIVVILDEIQKERFDGSTIFDVISEL